MYLLKYNLGNYRLKALDMGANVLVQVVVVVVDTKGYYGELQEKDT